MKRFIVLAAVFAVALVGLVCVSDANAQGMGGLTAAQICPPAQNGPVNQLACCGQAQRQAIVNAPAPPVPGLGLVQGGSASASASSSGRVLVQEAPLGFQQSFSQVPVTTFQSVPVTTFQQVPVQTFQTVALAPVQTVQTVAVQGASVQTVACVGPLRRMLGNHQANVAQRHANRAARNGATVAFASPGLQSVAGGSSAAAAASSN